MMTTALSEALDLLGGEKFPKCESPSLRLGKFVRIGDKSKREEIETVVACQARHGRAPSEQPLPSDGVRFPAKLKSRLIVNQAGGILENAGLCLHSHFGYPYIPGSAVKGVARHAAWCEWHEAEEPRKADIARKMARVFGYPTGDKGLDKYLKDLSCDAPRGGCVSFWAAEPDGKAVLVTDIVNCHHMKYYGDDNPSAVATDDETPNLQFFPAVESGATFLFTLVPLRGAGAEDVKLAKAWLVKALTENGVGAKTSAGYGWFEYSKEAESEYVERQRKREEEAKRKKHAEAIAERIRALKNMDAATAAFVAEIDAIAREGLEGLPQVDVEEFNRQKKRVPQLSPREAVLREWDGRSVQECAQSHYILGFDKKPDAVKTAVVSVLREHPVWKYLRAGDFSDVKKKQQKPLRAQVEAIRAFAKTTPEGKMP